MLFNSYEFIFVFLPLTWILWRMSCNTHKPRLALALLTTASVAFYSWWNPPFVLLLLASIVVNFVIGNKLKFSGGGGNKRKFILFAGIFFNLSLIGYYKYFNFFMQNLSALSGSPWQARDIFLPLGISFFTFQQISWLVDSYRLPPSAAPTPPSEREAFANSASQSPPHRGGMPEGQGGVFNQFLEYTLFVSFFPQLIAGPIVHHGQIIPQFNNKRTFVMNWRNFAIGLSLFSLGLFKKVVIADTLSPWVADGFDNTDALTFVEAWGAALSYTFQIYFDFSGYSDMAMGLGKFFNVDIPMNFNSPYKSTSIIDFWRRWHMTLSQFLRDYVYIPLGGNRRGEFFRYVNLMLTMLIGGLWHGAAWQFVFWGFLHGFYLCVNNFWRRASEKFNIFMPQILGWLLTFTSVVVAWVFFRAENFTRAIEILKGMFGWNGVFIPEHYLPVQFLRTTFEVIGVRVGQVSGTWHFFGTLEGLAISLLVPVVLLFKNSQEWTERNLNSKINFGQVIFLSALTGMIFFLSIHQIFGAVGYSEFLYFNF